MSDGDYSDDDLNGQLDKYDQFELDLERVRLRNSLFEFVKDAWPLIEPVQAFVPNWHLEELCKILEEVTAGKIQRVIINVPPGTLKSILISVFWTAWMWAKAPGLRVLTASYGAHLTTRDNLRVRDIILSGWFQKLFPLKLVEDQNTKTRFNTNKGGWRIATSVGGVGTGEHPDIIVIDDPTTAAQALSAPDRKTANDWFDGTISTRGMTRNPRIVIVMQRLHADDLSGHLLARGGWQHVCWPMRYVATRPKTEDDPGHTADPRDIRTVAGELLFPTLIPAEKVRLLELDLGPYGTAGQLQQAPSPEGGGLFKREWFKFLDESELKTDPVVRAARGWDTAATEGAGDWTRGVKIGETAAGRFVIFAPASGQLGPDGVDKLMKATADADGSSVVQREEKEGGASGVTVIAARLKLLKGHDYKGVTISGNKAVRAKPYRAQVEGGNVYLIRGPWNEEFIVEHTAFPTGSHDDYVDGASCAFNSVLLEPYYEVRVREAQWA